jgi:hypothetical protein
VAFIVLNVTSDKIYVGQTGRNFKITFSEHQRYIKTNNPKSGYALHILNNKHENGITQNIMQQSKNITKGGVRIASKNIQQSNVRDP